MKSKIDSLIQEAEVFIASSLSDIDKFRIQFL